jgi:ribose 5-phosphate isomerase B
MSNQPANQEAQVAALVREVVERTLGKGMVIAQPAATREKEASGRRPLLDENMVRQMPAGSTQRLPADTLITPLARQAAQDRQIRLETIASPHASTAPAQESFLSTTPTPSPAKAQPILAIGADHGGYALKEQLKSTLAAAYQVVDCGTHSSEAVDYPDFAYAVARMVADGRAWRGIIIDGAGIGSCMVANKVPGVRAALCYDQASAVNSREHNNANVLTLGAGLIGPALARLIVETWLGTEFGGGRHARRVDKINQLDRRYR